MLRISPLTSFFLYILSSACVFLLLISQATAANIQFTYDQLDRLTRVESTNGASIITYTYDSVGNRLSIVSQGTNLDTPLVTDPGECSMDNSALVIDVTTYGEEYGNLEYEYAIGTTAGGTDVVNWTHFDIGFDGSTSLDGLNLPYDQEYFVSVRIKNFAGDIVSDVGSSDGIIVLDPLGDYDGDGFSSESEVLAESNPLNPYSYPGLTIVQLRPGFNLIAIPADITNHPDLNYWMPTLGDATEIEKVMAYDDLNDKFVTLFPDDPTNEAFILQGGEGLIVYAYAEKDVLFESVLCSPNDFNQGFNLVGFACPPDSDGAFELLTDLGSENVSSIQRYNPETGAFETASFDENEQPIGIDFQIVLGEGYFVFMKQAVKGF